MSKREIPVDEQEETPGVEDRLAQLESENAKLRDQALRAMADLENVRRRAAGERDQIVQYGNERLLRELLPIVDDIQRSVTSGGQSKDYDSFYQGVSMINDKVKKLLEMQGVRQIPTVGEAFNVELHEALMRQPSDEPEERIIGELEPGYTYGEKVLRHAKVVISSGN